MARIEFPENDWYCPGCTVHGAAPLSESNFQKQRRHYKLFCRISQKYTYKPSQLSNFSDAYHHDLPGGFFMRALNRWRSEPAKLNALNELVLAG